MSDDLAAQVTGVGALVEPARRSLYLFVAAQPAPVSREQAATAVDLPLHSVKFHLDRLVEEGLLDVEFRRLSGKSGPGAGRPSKLYRRSDRQLSVSLPVRRYDLAGQVLAAAVERSIGEALPVEEAVSDAARQEGLRIAAAAAEGNPGPSPSAPDNGEEAFRDDLARTSVVLAGHGYEPRTSHREICLANCPFDRLATEHTALVCGMNLALIEGVLDGLVARTLTAELAPRAGFCCVTVHRGEDG